MHWIALQPMPEPGLAGHAQSRPGTELVDGLAALSWWALQFTPLVARVEDALVLEVSASSRLFGGPAGVCRRMLAFAPAAGQLLHAQADTSLLALGRMWAGQADAPADALPIEVLFAAREHLDVLRRLGCTQWGHLQDLPRAGLARRFGQRLPEALDRAYGKRPDAYSWLIIPEVFEVSLELVALVETAPALLFGARRLLAQLRLWLQARQQGVMAFEFGWQLDPRRSNSVILDACHSGDGWGRLELRTAVATQDMQHLQHLLGEQLARISLPVPVQALRLRTLQTEKLSGQSHCLLPEDVRQGDSLHQMLERLSARLGAGQVLCASLREDHRPEHMQQWQDWTNAPHLPAGPGPRVSRAAAVGPAWLLAAPLRLQVRDHCPQYQGALSLLAGPQRLEAGWLQGLSACALRDYYVARNPAGQLLWVYRERLAERDAAASAAAWYLHGIFA
jgi:protein ImuB